MIKCQQSGFATAWDLGKVDHFHVVSQAAVDGFNRWKSRGTSAYCVSLHPIYLPSLLSYITLNEFWCWFLLLKQVYLMYHRN